MKKVITYGTWDCLHWGHINLLMRAKQQGDWLCVGLSTDDFNKEKGKESLFSFEERYELLKQLPFVDEIIKEESWEQKEIDIEEYGINLVVMGDDWKGTFDDLHCPVVYLPRTEGISTSKIKRRSIKKFRSDVSSILTRLQHKYSNKENHFSWYAGSQVDLDLTPDFENKEERLVGALTSLNDFMDKYVKVIKDNE